MWGGGGEGWYRRVVVGVKVSLRTAILFQSVTLATSSPTTVLIDKRLERVPGFTTRVQ